MKRIVWDPNKAEWLAAHPDRKVTFEQCVIALENGDILDDRVNPTRKEQRIFILEIDGYAYVVPYVEDEESIFLKTVFPSRKYYREFFE